jgi:hypothetical protein
MSRLGIAKGTVDGKIVVLKAEQPQRKPVKPLPFPAHQSAELLFKFSKIRHVRFWFAGWLSATAEGEVYYTFGPDQIRSLVRGGQPVEKYGKEGNK